MERALNLIQHPAFDAPDPPERREKEIPLKGVVNILNFLNFQNIPVVVKFRHHKHKNVHTLKALPLPCSGIEARLQWLSKVDPHFLQYHSFEKIEIFNDGKILVAAPEVITLTSDEITFNLPKSFIEYSTRTQTRYPAKAVSAKIIQNSSVFDGELVDFSLSTFKVHVQATPPQTLQWITDTAPINVLFSSRGQTIYSGECNIIRASQGRTSGFIVLQSTEKPLTRFKRRKFRSIRRELLPSPLLSFDHPLSGSHTTLKIDNISGSGCLVHEEQNAATLFPGLILPKATLVFSEAFTIDTIMQVIHAHTKESGMVAYGLAILHMNDVDQIRLLSHLQRADDNNFFICNKIQNQKLWDFFFSTGFIYPEKYEALSENKQDIDSVYERLYSGNPSIARHFTYEKNGKILGHIAMLRLHENSWMIHHHAAQRSVSNKAGLAVLSQISRYVNELHTIYSSHLKYVFCYFRMANKFPRRVFAGVAEHISDQEKCSLDTFAYFNPCRRLPGKGVIAGNWSLQKSTEEDITALSNFYSQASGGLALKTFDLESHSFGNNTICDEFKRSGFKKGRECFSLKQDQNVSAVFVVDIADFAMNMSDLTNCIKIFVLDTDVISGDLIMTVLSILEAKYFTTHIPALLYPVEAAAHINLKYDKEYTLWALDLENLDHYFTYCSQFYKDM